MALPEPPASIVMTMIAATMMTIAGIAIKRIFLRGIDFSLPWIPPEALPDLRLSAGAYGARVTGAAGAAGAAGATGNWAPHLLQNLTPF